MPTRSVGVLLLTLAGLYQVAERSMADDWNSLDPGYRHASPAALERWRDMKYGLRICWGQYNLWNIEASWPVLKMPDTRKQQYFDLHKQFNPVAFDAEEWMDLLERGGLKFFTILTKHHDGFSMYDTQTRVKRRVSWAAPGGPKIEACDLSYSIMESPFHRDIVKELCDAAHKRGIGIDLYFSHCDWFDADFRGDPDHPFYDKKYNHKTDPEGYARMVRRHREQIREVLTNYGKVDMMCLDQSHLPGMRWEDMKETIFMARRLQPDCLFRNRGIGAYGDYHTPENWIPDSPESRESKLPWMVIYNLARLYTYDPNPANYKPGSWIVSNLIDIVAKGGNFMVILGPDAKGKFHPEAVKRLEYAGDWLKVNGEAIYKSRPWVQWKEGTDVRFTRSKDGQHVYAITLRWPGKAMRIRSIRPRPGSTIRMLGYARPLVWRWDGAQGLVVDLPDELQDEAKRPCKQAYSFRIEGTMVTTATGMARAGDGRVQFAVVGEDQQPLPCRIHLKDHLEKPRYAEEMPRWADHFVCPGIANLRLPAGDYTFEIERGPEYRRESDTFHLGEGETKRIGRGLKRLADLAAEGWLSGELHVHRPAEQVRLLMQAEDLHVVPVITWWNNESIWRSRRLPANVVTRFDGDRWLDVMAGEDEREGGALLYFRLAEPLAIAGSSREYPSPMKFLLEARRHPGAWIDIEKPFWWDVPVWLASGQVDSIGLANNHMCRSGMSATEAWGKPRDTALLPPPRGNGYWSQEIYYHVLNCGIRVPPSAGSASGVLPNPVGYNRVYVHLGRELTYETWWQGLKAGRSFVTNGPLLLVRADGQLPGHVFTATEGTKVVLRLEARVASSDRIAALEIVQNGRVEQKIPPDQLAAGGPATITFDRSGWFLVRAIADVPYTFRFASTAPYYVEIGQSKRRISRSSARFFLNWVDERSRRVPQKLHDPAQLQEVLGYHRRAKEFWETLLVNANAE